MTVPLATARHIFAAVATTVAAGTSVSRSMATLRSALVGLAAVFVLAACDSGRPQFKNTDVTGADYAKDFALTDHTAKHRHRRFVWRHATAAWVDGGDR